MDKCWCGLRLEKHLQDIRVEDYGEVKTRRVLVFGCPVHGRNFSPITFKPAEIVANPSPEIYIPASNDEPQPFATKEMREEHEKRQQTRIEKELARGRGLDAQAKPKLPDLRELHWMQCRICEKGSGALDFPFVIASLDDVLEVSWLCDDCFKHLPDELKFPYELESDDRKKRKKTRYPASEHSASPGMRSRTPYCKHGFLMVLSDVEFAYKHKVKRSSYCSECSGIWTEDEDVATFGAGRLMHEAIYKFGNYHDQDQFEYFEGLLRAHLVEKAEQINAVWRDPKKPLKQKNGYIRTVLKNLLLDWLDSVEGQEWTNTRSGIGANTREQERILDDLALRPADRLTNHDDNKEYEEESLIREATRCTTTKTKTGGRQEKVAEVTAGRDDRSLIHEQEDAEEETSKAKLLRRNDSASAVTTKLDWRAPFEGGYLEGWLKPVKPTVGKQVDEYIKEHQGQMTTATVPLPTLLPIEKMLRLPNGASRNIVADEFLKLAPDKQMILKLRCGFEVDSQGQFVQREWTYRERGLLSTVDPVPGTVMTQEETARVLNFTRDKVRQLETTALAELSVRVRGRQRRFSQEIGIP